MNSTGKKIVSHGSIYFIGNILRHAVSFVMLPIYTRVLTPADYGTIELLTMVIDFAGIIFGLRIGAAIFRFYSMAENEIEKNRFVSSSMILTMLLNFCGFLIIFGSAGFLSRVIFGQIEQKEIIIQFSITMLFQPLIEIPMVFIRAQQRPWLFVIFSTMKLLLQLSLNIYLVVFLALGVEGVVLSAVISGGIISLLLGSYCFAKVGLNFKTSSAKELIGFSYPMILASVISFYLTFGDRYFLKLYGTLSDVGIYALGYKFGFLLTFIAISPFFSIWDSERYSVLKKPDAKNIFQEVFVVFTVFILIIAVGISVFAKNILSVMAKPEFVIASRLVPIVLLAYIMQGFTGYCNLGIIIHKRTFLITNSMLLSATIITILYFLLIPSYGATGAAWATALTFTARLIYVYNVSKKLYSMELPWKKIIYLLILSAIVVIISVLGPSKIIWSILMNLILYISFIYMLSLIPILNVKQRTLLRSLLLRPWHIHRQIIGMVQLS